MRQFKSKDTGKTPEKSQNLVNASTQTEETPPKVRRQYRLDENRTFNNLAEESESAGNDFAAHLSWTSGRIFNWAKTKINHEEIHAWVSNFIFS